MNLHVVYKAVQSDSNFWVCRWNPQVWPFKGKQLSWTALWLCCISCASNFLVLKRDHSHEYFPTDLFCSVLFYCKIASILVWDAFVRSTANWKVTSVFLANFNVISTTLRKHFPQLCFILLSRSSCTFSSCLLWNLLHYLSLEISIFSHWKSVFFFSCTDGSHI